MFQGRGLDGWLIIDGSILTTITETIMQCVICKGPIEVKKTPEGKVYWTEGNNADPVADGRCCDSCDWNVVIPTRLKGLIKE